MTQASIVLTAFNGGEWSPDLHGRIENQYYATSCTYLENFIPKIQGPLLKRPGTYFVARPKYNNRKCKFIKFQFNRTQTYFLEFGHLYMRVYKDHGSVLESAISVSGITKANPAVVTTSTTHGFSTGDEVYISDVVGMIQVNGNRFKITVLTTTTFSLQDLDGNNVNSSSYTTYSSGGTVSRVYEVVTPWTESDLVNLRWTQSADVLFMACSGYPPKTITRSGHASWSLANYDFQDGPYKSINITTTTIQPSATTGTSITLTASAAIFASTDVGRWVRIKHSSTWGVAKITAYTSATVVTASVLSNYPFSATTASTSWRLGLWTSTGNIWPQCMEFFQNRLWWFTGEQVDGSYSGSYYFFSPTEADGTVTDSNAIQRTLGSRDVNTAIWAADNEKALVCGTQDGEWVIRANTLGDVVTPTNCNTSRSSDFGSKNIPGMRNQNNVVFVQRTGRILAQIAYSLEADGFTPEDLNLFNTEINQKGISSFAIMSQPDNNIFCAKEDGSASVITYNPSQSVKGWSRFTTYNGLVEDFCTGPAPGGKSDEVWMVVNRRINGTYIRTIEYMDDFFRHDTWQEDCMYLDCALTYDGRVFPSADLSLSDDKKTLTASSGVFLAGDVGKIISTAEGKAVISGFTSSTTVTLSSFVKTFQSQFYKSGFWCVFRNPVTSISGIPDFMNGTTVSVVGDGAMLSSAVVSSGSITLSDQSCVVHIGYPYKSKYESSRPNAGAADGTAQGKIKRVDGIVLRLWSSLGGQYGSEGSAYLDDISYRSPDDSMDTQMDLFTGDTEKLPLPSEYNSGSRIIIVHDAPLPFNLVSIIMFLVTQDGR